MSYNMMILNCHLPYFHVSKGALFLHSILVLSFYIDVILTLSILAKLKHLSYPFMICDAVC